MGAGLFAEGLIFGVLDFNLDTGAVSEKEDKAREIAEQILAFQAAGGEIEQVPPAYSALKVDGKRAYDRARAGEEVKLRSRRVTIHSLAMGSGYVGQGAELRSSFQTTAGRPDPYDPSTPLELADCVTITAHVSKGTYIRSLARDIAHALGTVGHVTYLRRTKAGPFTETQAISLDKLNEIANGAQLSDLLLPLEAGLDDIPALNLTQTDAQALQQGRVVSGLPQPPGLHCAMLDARPIALVEIEEGTAKVVRGFNLPDVAE